MSATIGRGPGLPLALALAIGVLGDWLLRAPGEPGLNIGLMALAGSAAVLALRGTHGLRGWNGALLCTALLFGLALAWRDAGALRFLNLLAAMTTALLAAGAGAWIVRAGVSDYVRSGAYAALTVAAGPAPLLVGAPKREGKRHRYRTPFAVLRGALIAAPLLLVFGGLLASSDPVFERLVSNLFAFDLGTLLGHAALVAVLAWGSAGYLGRWTTATSDAPAPLPLQLPRPQVGLVEGAVVLGLLDALFLAFVLVQLRYLFGGADLVEVTPGLSYAEYARRGFFELVAVAALVVPLLLAADWIVRRERPVERWTFHGLAFAQILLLFAILGSALYRMHLYRESYGLTEQRLYTTWFMSWIAFMLAWLAITVLQGRRERFAIGAFTSGLVMLLALNVLNPHATIARVNAERSAAGLAFDVHHAARLPGDAVPTVLATIDGLPHAERCLLAHLLLERWTRQSVEDWRTFNLGEWRGRTAVHEARSNLEAVRCAPAPSSGAAERAAAAVRVIRVRPDPERVPAGEM